MNIKKHVIVLVAVVMIITSCTSYTSVGAGVGAYWGSSIGSAIGGIADGFRGSNIGSLIGMVGGAAVGAAIGSEQDKAYQEDMQQYREEKARLAANREVRNSAGKHMNRVACLTVALTVTTLPTMSLTSTSAITTVVSTVKKKCQPMECPQ